MRKYLVQAFALLLIGAGIVYAQNQNFGQGGLVRAGDGTAALPSITFQNAPSTGFYHTTTNLWVTSNGTTQALFGANIFRVGSGSIHGWSSNADPSLAISDTNITRSAAGVLQVGTAEGANASGSLKLSALVSAGTVPTITGTGACATSGSQAGGATAGVFTCTAATAASTFTITFGLTAPNGYVCDAWDETTGANAPHQTSHSTTTCVLTVTSVTQNDVIAWKAIGF